ncbi:MAG: dehydrogenase, partial [Marivirga sp.]|nr:dehydrogenase [Marivirga sp.]
IIIGSQKIDGHYAMHPITDKVRQVDVFGGFTAAAGHNFYTARAYPEEFRNIAFVCEPTGHLIHMARIERDGAGFVEKDGWNIFAGADEWVAPVEAKVGPDGAVWVLDWYNFIIQHNPTPTPERGGFQAVNGPGNAYENPLRDKSHGRVWRIVHREMKPFKPMQLSKDDTGGLVEALGSDNMFWRMTAQRLLVESGNNESESSLVDLVKNEKVDKDGNNFSALHALWTLDGLGLIKEDGDPHTAAVNALKHPAPGVRKAAIQILSKVKWNGQTVVNSGILNDSDPGTRLAAILSLGELPPSDSIGTELYSLSQDKSITEDDWLAKATYVAAAKHHEGFIKAYMKAHPDYEAPKPVPPVTRETADLDDANWKTMKLPQNIEKAGLEIDGLIWFRVNVEIPKSMAGKKATLSLGPIDESDITFLNGTEIGSNVDKYNIPRLYQIPAGKLKAGKNSIAVRVEDKGGRGGIHGRDRELYIAVGRDTVALAGDWKYDVEKEYSATRKNIFKEVSLADVFLKHYGENASPVTSEPESFAKDATVIRIKVIKNEMKYDLKSFIVEAGKAVEIIFENPDFMQHNLVITKQGTMKIVGAAADKLAADPKGAEMNYVPSIPEVLFATKLVNPEQTETLRFIAPKDAGDYPFVCTFPGHWALMNGVMKVVKTK